MASYSPRLPPTRVEDMASYLTQELQNVSNAMSGPNQTLVLDMSYSAPSKPRNGVIALADGTSWNPGGGAGYYGYLSGSWVKLG